MSEPNPQTNEPNNEPRFESLALMAIDQLNKTRDKLQDALENVDSLPGIRARLRDVLGTLRVITHTLAAELEEIEVADEGEANNA